MELILTFRELMLGELSYLKDRKIWIIGVLMRNGAKIFKKNYCFQFK